MGFIGNVKARKQEKTAERWFEMGNRTRTPVKKVKYYTNALEINPQNALAWRYKGDALNEMGISEEAEDCYAKAAQIEGSGDMGSGARFGAAAGFPEPDQTGLPARDANEIDVTNEVDITDEIDEYNVDVTEEQKIVFEDLNEVEEAESLSHLNMEIDHGYSIDPSVRREVFSVPETKRSAPATAYNIRKESDVRDTSTPATPKVSEEAGEDVINRGAPKYVVASKSEEKNMSHYSINEFIESTGQRDLGQGSFELERDRLLEVNLSGSVWTKMGSMVAYLGNVKFSREGILEHGLGKLVKKKVTGEGLTLTKAEGQGKVYLADAGKKISIIDLNNQSIYVNGNDLLAFEDTVKWDIKMLKKIAGMLSGGLFNVKLEGVGMVAITTHYDPLTLRVTPDNPVYTDPNATVAWSGNLQPDLKTDISLKTFVGRTSGESVQMKFEGEGFVVIQPYEEVAYSQTVP